MTRWSRGGKTDIDNGTLLCNYHHHQVHTGNLAIVPDTRSTTGQRDRSGTDEPGRRRWRVQRTARVRHGSSKKPHPGRFLLDVQLASAASQPSRGAKPPEPADLQPEPHGTSADTNAKQNTSSTTSASERPKHRGDRPRSDKTAPDAADDAEPA